MKKALLVTTVSGFIPQFEMNNVKILQDMGYEVHYASNYNTPSYGTDNHRLDGTAIMRHQVDFVRSPFNLANKKVYMQLKKLMEEEKFQLVHCHTPMGGVMARLAAHATKTGPVIYTAHGFHFFKGASAINWLCYYPVERFLSRYTEQQICINREDYERAKTFHAKYVNYIPGVGVNIEKIQNVALVDKSEKRKELGLADDQIVVISAGELIKRKNHETAIRAIAKLNNPNVVYLICGHGILDEYLNKLVQELHMEKQIKFLGYRSDIFEIYQIADLCLFPSYQEGLPMALLEAMACGLPVVCSDIRGSRDLMKASLQHEKKSKWKLCHGGALVKKADDVEAYAEAINKLLENRNRMIACGKWNKNEAMEFDSCKVTAIMKEIYLRLDKEKA